ncbi:ROK family transcriptional regulator [Actinacidiphila sp. bgisy167]|uniref:ROK family transcriptional regulator n=1 Tax=Actinacidiphila sp. bgisy167 TaxID=3413797 RepID=UPI003D735D15
MTAIRPPTGRTASPRTARAINDRLALELLQREGPLTAAQLKALTGLSRPSVADLVERLQESGLIAVVGETGADRRGPNARLYGIVADRAHLAAFDVRTHSVAIEVADLLGNAVGSAVLPVDPVGDPQRTVRRSVALLERTAYTAGAGALHTIAVGAPGLVDPATGELRATGQLPAWHSALVAELRRRLSLPVLLENEVNLAAVAERRLGSVRDREDFVLLWLGHGVGAAVVLGGVLRRGASGGTGEIGFLPVPGTFQLPTASGCEGGFHSLAGSAAVCALARSHGIAVSGADDAAAAEAVVTAARAGGKQGELFLDALADRVVIGVAAVSAVLDPGCVVLGGEVGRAGGADLAARVEERLGRMSPLPTQVRAGTVAGSAVLRGAVLLAMDAAQDALFTPEG